MEGLTGDVRFAMIYVQLSNCWTDELPSAATAQSSGCMYIEGLMLEDGGLAFTRKLAAWRGHRPANDNDLRGLTDPAH